MTKKAVDTDIGVPDGPSYHQKIIRLDPMASSMPDEAGNNGFLLTLRVGSNRKFSFSYNVTSAQKKRANLLANGRRTKVSSDQE